MDTTTRRSEAMALLALDTLKDSNAARFNVLTALQSGLRLTPEEGGMPEFITIFYYDDQNNAHQIPDYTTDFHACRRLPLPAMTGWSMFFDDTRCEAEIIQRADDTVIASGKGKTLELAMLAAWWHIQPGNE
jgi:hypothetical protein